MNLFPFFEDITGKTFLLIGGGRVAAGAGVRVTAVFLLLSSLSS